MFRKGNIVQHVSRRKNMVLPGTCVQRRVLIKKNNHVRNYFYEAMGITMIGIYSYGCYVLWNNNNNNTTTENDFDKLIKYCEKKYIGLPYVYTTTVTFDENCLKKDYDQTHFVILKNEGQINLNHPKIIDSSNAIYKSCATDLSVIEIISINGDKVFDPNNDNNMSKLKACLRYDKCVLFHVGYPVIARDGVIDVYINSRRALNDITKCNNGVHDHWDINGEKFSRCPIMVGNLILCNVEEHVVRLFGHRIGIPIFNFEIKY